MSTDEPTEYEDLRDYVIERFNPPDDDIAEPAIMRDAVGRAADLIESLPCTCPTDFDSYGDACGRCYALGRHMDVAVTR